MKKIHILLFCILFVKSTIFMSELTAQDAIFAQHYASPLYLNPAMMGVYQGQYRFNANYRQQWSGIFSDVPIRQIHASFDYRFRIADDDFLAFGINALEDELGADSKIKSTRGNIGISYMKQLSGNRYRSADQYLVIGAQVGTGQYSAGTGGLWFDLQYDSANIAVNTALPTGELSPQSPMFFDVNAGLMWYTVAGDNRSFHAGASVQHLTQPNVSFFGNKSETLKRRFIVHAGGEFPLNDQLSLLPSMMTTLQGPSITTQLGANFRYSNHDWDEVAIRIGGWYRLSGRYVSNAVSSGNVSQPATSSKAGLLGDAFTVTTMLELNRWLIGVSYDIHTSSIIKPTNGRGGFELSLIYVAPERIAVKTACPKF